MTCHDDGATRHHSASLFTTPHTNALDSAVTLLYHCRNGLPHTSLDVALVVCGNLLLGTYGMAKFLCKLHGRIHCFKRCRQRFASFLGGGREGNSFLWHFFASYNCHDVVVIFGPLVCRLWVLPLVMYNENHRKSKTFPELFFVSCKDIRVWLSLSGRRHATSAKESK